jgi:signal transduction histidine kinase
MDEVLEGLLTLSRLGRTSLDVSQVDLSDLVRVIMAEKLMAENERPVDFIIEPGQVASCDGRLMRIALENLVSNALKFTRKRDRARIEFGVRNSDEKPVWFLSDNGVGFPPEDAERIFQPFQRVHSEAEFPGNGIGLATVHRIIKLHGGKIRAEGDVDKGACFYFSL